MLSFPPGVTVCSWLAWLDLLANCHVDDRCEGGEEGGGTLDHDIMSGAINWDQAGEGISHCNYQMENYHHLSLLYPTKVNTPPVSCSKLNSCSLLFSNDRAPDCDIINYPPGNNHR